MSLKKISINLNLIILTLFYILVFFYYLYFINKGIVIYDEGYYAHIAERILSGQIPYQDFFVQFTPGYFYLLALFYKIFGVSVFSDRFLTFIFCLGIIYLTSKLVSYFKLNIRLRLISLLAVVSFGFPLINNTSLMAWPVVFLSLMIVIIFMKKKYILLGVVLSLILLTKQNIGIYLLILTELFLVISKVKFKQILKVSISFIIPTIIWFSYFFLILNRFDRFIELIKFNSRYLSVYHFSYPSLSFLLQPTGIFKLLPYYFPVILLLFVARDFFSKKRDVNALYLCTVSLVGFFGTIYPTSDLLHVYPFLGMVIVSSIIFFNGKKLSLTLKSIILIITGILIISGFYLELFREYYRYQPAYRYQKTKLELPRANSIHVDKPLALQLSSVNLFFLINTKKKDSILCYPFCPMAYFLFQRNNPSRYSTYYPGYLTESQEKYVLYELKQKKTKYILTFLDYKFNTPISKFIQKQKEVYKIGQFKIFQIE